MAGISAKAKDLAVFDSQRLSGEEPDAVGAVSGPVEGQVAKRHDNRVGRALCAVVDDDAGSQAGENAAEAGPCPPSIVMFLVIVTAPKPAGSRASISPLAAVLEMAPAKVLQGAVRLQGLTSSPTPDTQVRVACAWASDAKASSENRDC